MKKFFLTQEDQAWKNPLQNNKRPKISYFGTLIAPSDKIYYAAAMELVLIPEPEKGLNGATPINTAIIIPILESDFDIFGKSYEYVDLGDKIEAQDLKIFKEIPLFINRSRKGE